MDSHVIYHISSSRPEQHSTRKIPPASNIGTFIIYTVPGTGSVFYSVAEPSLFHFGSSSGSTFPLILAPDPTTPHWYLLCKTDFSSRGTSIHAQYVLVQLIPEHLPLRSKSGTVSFFIILIFRLLAYTSTLSYMYWYTVQVPAVRYIPVPVYKLSLLIMILK